MSEYGSNIIIVINAFCILFAVIIYAIFNFKQRKELRLHYYENLSKEYREFLKICLDYPTFNTDTLIHENSYNITEEQNKQHYILYQYLVSILESAYLQVSNPKSKVQKVYWNKWNNLMQSWMWREDFVKVWKEQLWMNFNEDFSKHMNSLEFWRCGTLDAETMFNKNKLEPSS